MPMDALVKDHNVLVTLASENIELRAWRERAAYYIAQLEKTVKELSGSKEEAANANEADAPVDEAEDGSKPETPG